MRKWQTLFEGYKKALQNNNSTGRGPSRFQWFTEMDCLFSSRCDINPIVTGTQSGVTVHRPEELSRSRQPLQSESSDDQQQSAEQQPQHQPSDS